VTPTEFKVDVQAKLTKVEQALHERRIQHQIQLRSDNTDRRVGFTLNTMLCAPIAFWVWLDKDGDMQWGTDNFV